MVKEKAVEPYSDFCLVELSHLSPWAGLKIVNDVEGINFVFRESAIAETKKRFDFGKKLIDEKTKPGDLIAIEFPENFLPNKQTMPEDQIRFYDVLKEVDNKTTFYDKLAKYAESKGVRVVSLEPGVASQNSRLLQAYISKGLPPEKVRAMRYLVTWRRHRFMKQKIQAKKPQLVFCAEGHAMYLNHFMKPKEVIWYGGEPDKEKVEQYFKDGLRKTINYYRGKKRRIKATHDRIKQLKIQTPKI